VAVLGEKGGDSDQYLQITSESTKVGGRPGQLGIKVLDLVWGTLGRVKAALRHRMQWSNKN
jgi:hypothetical protein